MSNLDRNLIKIYSKFSTNPLATERGEEKGEKMGIYVLSKRVYPCWELLGYVPASSLEEAAKLLEGELGQTFLDGSIEFTSGVFQPKPPWEVYSLIGLPLLIEIIQPVKS